MARSVDQDVAAVLPSRLDGDLRLEALRSVLLEQDRAALAALQQKFDDPRQFTEAVSAVLAQRLRPCRGPGRTARPRFLRRPWSAPRGRRSARIPAPWSASSTRSSDRRFASPSPRPLTARCEGSTRRSSTASHGAALKWRLEAYRSGSTFAEVVLKHTVVFRVEHLFLIHRKTGLLLEHVAGAGGGDAGSAAGLRHADGHPGLRARFVQPGQRHGDASGIDSLRLGDLLLWCEEGPFAFLAAVIRGNPPETLHAVLRDTLTSIHEELRGPLRGIQGRQRDPGGSGRPAGGLPAAKEQPPEKRLSPWLWALPLALLLVAGSWLVFAG